MTGTRESLGCVLISRPRFPALSISRPRTHSLTPPVDQRKSELVDRLHGGRQDIFDLSVILSVVRLTSGIQWKEAADAWGRYIYGDDTWRRIECDTWQKWVLICQRASSSMSSPLLPLLRWPLGLIERRNPIVSGDRRCPAGRHASLV